MVIKKFFARRAQRQAQAQLTDGQVLCATLLPGGKPVFFPTSVDATEDEVRAEAFRRRHGRIMSELEASLLRVAEARRHA